MPVTLIALTELRPGGEAALARYLEVTGPLMEAAGAKILSRYERVTAISETTPPQYITQISYPDHAAVRQVFEHPDYLALAEIRDAAFERYEIAEVR